MAKNLIWKISKTIRTVKNKCGSYTTYTKSLGKWKASGFSKRKSAKK